jgi:hypothetical protein
LCVGNNFQKDSCPARVLRKMLSLGLIFHFQYIPSSMGNFHW